MLDTFRCFGFELTDDREEGLVRATKSIDAAGTTT
jgi:hypothetical protein